MSKNARGRVTTRFPWRKLKGFLDWLIDPREWPVKARDTGKRKDAIARWNDTRALRRRAEKLMLAVEDSRLRQATTLIRELEQSKEHEKRFETYVSPHGVWTSTHGIGNIEFQRRVFVGRLAMERFRQSNVYRKRISPHGDHFLNIASYIKDKGCAIDFYDMTKQAYYRYRRKRDSPARAVIISLYEMYLRESGSTWVLDRKRRFEKVDDTFLVCREPLYSEREGEMLESLARIALKDRHT